MKRHGYLMEKIVEYSNLEMAYFKALKGRRRKGNEGESWREKLNQRLNSLSQKFQINQWQIVQ